jgi:hypothetical protein
MASELKVNTLTGVSTAGSIAVTGEGNSTTTNLQQGLAKAWVHFTQVSTQTIRDSLNVSGLTDGGTGLTTVSINNDMSNDDWAGSLYQNASAGTGAGDWDNHHAGGLTSRATGSVLVTGYASALVDSALCDVIVLGDLA